MVFLKKNTMMLCEMKEFGNHCPMEWTYWILASDINYK